jgi:hypothetical protein
VGCSLWGSLTIEKGSKKMEWLICSLCDLLDGIEEQARMWLQMLFAIFTPPIIFSVLANLFGKEREECVS